MTVGKKIHGFSLESKGFKPYWVILILIYFAYFFTMFYGDMVITSGDSFALLDCIANRDFFSFYDRLCAYPITIYLIFDIWNLPAWILCRLGLTTWNSIGCFLWVKGLVVVALIGCIWVFHKLLQKTACPNPNFWMFIFASSLFTVLPIFATVQYDVLELFVGLCGIYMASQEDTLSCKTLLVLSLSVSIKLMMAFPFVFVILLKEKRILYILRDGLALITVTVLSMLPFFIIGSSGTSTTSFAAGMILHMIRISLPGGLYDISLYASCFIAACIMAYCTHPAKGNKGADFLQKLAWLSCIHFFAFFLFGEKMHPFWIVLSSPFIALLLAQNSGRVKMNLLLENIAELCLILLHSFYFNWVYLSDDLFSDLILKRIPSSDLTPFHNFGEIMDTFHADHALPGVAAALFVCWGALIILNHPYGGKHYIDEDESTTLAVTEHTACAFRLLFLAGYFALSLLVAFVL